jgi:glycosyltransferase involved in cell wall biosynthesis
MRLSLIINTCKQPEPLAKVLRGVALQTRWPDEVLIADDGSEAPTRDLIENWRAQVKGQVRYVGHPYQGFRRTIILNQAVKESAGDYLVFLDGDCVPHRGFIADHVSLAERGCWVQGRRCFVEQSWVRNFDPGRTPVGLWLMKGQIRGFIKAVRLPFAIVRRDKEQRGILGCNLACWRDDFEAVNGYDETYLGWGGEDSDLGSRLYHLGRRRKFVYGRAVVYHLNHPSVPRDRASDNFARLAETLRLRKIRCERGLAEHV